MKVYKLKIFGILIAMMTVVFCACGNDGAEILTSSGTETTQETTSKSLKKPDTIEVFICGEVKHPGVYRLKRDDRIVAAIKAAGGLTKKASYESVNQAQKMEDGQQITIPSKQKQSEREGLTKTDPASDLISINQATKEELMTLPGIGESKADAILAYRQEHGSFQSTKDLMNISGIKEGVYHKIEDKITL